MPKQSNPLKFDVYYGASPLGYIPPKYHKQVSERACIEYFPSEQRWVIYGQPHPPKDLMNRKFKDRQLKTDKDGNYLVLEVFDKFEELKNSVDKKLISICKKAEYTTGIEWFKKMKNDYIYEIIIDKKKDVTLIFSENNKLKIYFYENRFEHIFF